MLYAAEGQQGGSSAFIWILMALFFVALYFLMIRPQQKRRREVESMQKAIGPGDEIVTVGGLYGTVREIDQETVVLEIAPGISAKYARAAIGKVVTPAARPNDEEEPSTDAVEQD